MKHKIIERLSSPDFWVVVLSILAVIGLISVVAGYSTGNNQFVSIGWWLFLPLILGGVVLTFVIIPILIYYNIKGGGG